MRWSLREEIMHNGRQTGMSQSVLQFLADGVNNVADRDQVNLTAEHTENHMMQALSVLMEPANNGQHTTNLRSATSS